MKRERSSSSDERSVKAESQLNHLCKRCGDIKEFALARKSQNNDPVDYFKDPIVDSHKQLRSSTCQVCQLLACIKTPNLDASKCNLKASNLTKTFTPGRKLKPTSDPDTTLLSIVPDSNQPKSDTTHLGHVIAVEPSRHISAVSEQQRFEHENINFELIAEWIKDCDEWHTEGCKPGIPSPTETLQVIDCTKREYIERGTPVVVPLEEGCEYAALSYVWGDIKDDFPQVVKDSIEVVTKLNCQYLWVDRLVCGMNSR